MRLIEEQMVGAIHNKACWSKDNTSVTYWEYNNRSDVCLYGHHIAQFDHTDGEMSANLNTLAAWPTNTTKSRLRALGVNVATRKGVTYVDNKEVA